MWYTFENEATRPIKIMAEGIYTRCGPHTVVEGISRKGLIIIETVNIHSRKVNALSSTFMMTCKIEETKNISEIGNSDE